MTFAEICRRNLGSIARAYAGATGESMKTISRKFYGTAAFIEGFVAGEVSCSVETYDQLVEKFRMAWPPEARWPWTKAIILDAPRKGRKRRNVV